MIDFPVVTREQRAARPHRVDPASRGLGDYVALLAQPIARWLDARLPADPVLRVVIRLAVRAGWVSLPLAGCSACSARRRALNAWLPDLRRWQSWAGLARRIRHAIRARLTRA